MTTFPNSPRLRKGGIVLIDPKTSRVLRTIALQYNPDSLSRTLETQGAGEGGDRSEALRLTGPPKETIKLEAELDAADRRAEARSGQSQIQISLHAQLAALETVIYPPSQQVQEHRALAQQGVMEIAPAESPLTVFVWSAQRVLPVRITEFSVTEEDFDPELNPTRARISLGMRVLNADDLGFDNKGANLFTVYHQTKEQLAARYGGGDLLTTFGIRSI
jgi:hypothetical protein